uniref:Uncharacterized protein n=1 Tax=Bursaphelenchus xylophilus TaxID=6326 RepID=A0A1I7RKM0_BURXY
MSFHREVEAQQSIQTLESPPRPSKSRTPSPKMFFERIAAAQPAPKTQTPTVEKKKSEKEKSEVKEEKPAKEKSAKSKKPPVVAPGAPKSMRRKKDAPPPEDKKDEEEDNGYESCPDMTPEQLAKVVEENPK